jgi:hypothetical protein
MNPALSAAKHWNWQGGKTYKFTKIKGGRTIPSLDGVSEPKVAVAFPVFEETVANAKILNQQIEEMTKNPDTQEVYLNWTENTDKNGYYLFVSGSLSIPPGSLSTGILPFTGQLIEVAKPNDAMFAVQCNSRERDNDYTGIDPGAFHGVAASTGTALYMAQAVTGRTGEDGIVIAVGGAANQTLIRYEVAEDDLNKNDVVCYDTMGSATESDWVEVFGKSHNFTGDMVVSNGLIRFKTQITDGTYPGKIMVEFYDGSAWASAFGFYYRDDTNSVEYDGVAPVLSVKKVSVEEIKINLTWSRTVPLVAVPQIELTLQRAAYDIIAKANFVYGSAPAAFRVYNDLGGTGKDFGVCDSIIEPESIYDDSPTVTTENYIAVLENSAGFCSGICLTYDDAVGTNESADKIDNIYAEITDKHHSSF